MNKEELIDFIKENLKIEIRENVSQSECHYSKTSYLALILNNEIISTVELNSESF